MFGVNVDFVARSHCSVAIITIEDIQVLRTTAPEPAETLCTCAYVTKEIQ
jgi:hypothetical protein